MIGLLLFSHSFAPWVPFACMVQAFYSVHKSTLKRGRLGIKTKKRCLLCLIPIQIIDFKTIVKPQFEHFLEAWVIYPKVFCKIYKPDFVYTLLTSLA